MDQGIDVLTEHGRPASPTVSNTFEDNNNAPHRFEAVGRRRVACAVTTWDNERQIQAHYPLPRWATRSGTRRAGRRPSVNVQYCAFVAIRHGRNRILRLWEHMVLLARPRPGDWLAKSSGRTRVLAQILYKSTGTTDKTAWFRV